MVGLFGQLYKQLVDSIFTLLECVRAFRISFHLQESRVGGLTEGMRIW